MAAEDADTDGVVEGAQVLPDIVGDAGRVEAEEQLLAEDRGEGQGHVAKKHKGGVRCSPCRRAGVRLGMLL